MQLTGQPAFALPAPRQCGLAGLARSVLEAAQFLRVAERERPLAPRGFKGCLDLEQRGFAARIGQSALACDAGCELQLPPRDRPGQDGHVEHPVIDELLDGEPQAFVPGGDPGLRMAEGGGGEEHRAEEAPRCRK